MRCEQVNKRSSEHIVSPLPVIWRVSVIILSPVTRGCILLVAVAPGVLLASHFHTLHILHLLKSRESFVLFGLSDDLYFCGKV